MMKMTGGVRLALAVATALTPGAAWAGDPATTRASAATATLEEQFRDPPASARPRVWWHWMNGNVTKDGIAKDLAWMKRVGIGGLQNFDANLQTPQIVDHRLVYMTPEWKDAFRFAATEADRLGLELAIASSPGWSETGGPWVEPRDGMKKLVWSEIDIAGGKCFASKLPAPPDATGPFQSIATANTIGQGLGGGQSTPLPIYYADVAVLAYPVAAGRTLPDAAVTGGDGKALEGRLLIDADPASGIEIPKITGAAPILQFTYPAPQTVRSATLFSPGFGSAFGGASYLPKLEASDDGKTWRAVAEIPLGAVPTTVAFSPVTARQFRLVFNSVTAAGFSFTPQVPGVDLFGLAKQLGGTGIGAPKLLKVTDFRLSAEDRVDRVEAKAGFSVARDYYALSKELPEVAGVSASGVIDLTSRLRTDGTLDWAAPALPRGRQWRIVRLGYSLLGKTNHPAPAEATGLEVDKFDGAAVRRYMEHYLAMYKEAAGSDLVGARGVQAVLNDSIEVGPANWTPRMIAEFKRLRGYDPTPWLPAITGEIVGSRSESDKFLYDFRRTIADLMASEHYGTIAKVAHENGLKVYGEALEDNRPSLGDDMSMRSHADIPMSALWTFRREDGAKATYVGDMKGAASVAHVYGQNIAAAESMTALLAPWAFGPNDLKRIIDLEFVTGINRPVVHTSVHAPTDDKVPGLSLHVFGQYFNRHESWAELAKPWVDYLSRNAFMLQQGRNFADVAYFYGEEGPVTGLFGEKPVSDAPTRYAYDFLSVDALTSALSVDGNELVSSGGARYRALYLGGSSRKMTLPTLRRLASLVESGATIIGPRPVADPSLAGDPGEFAALTERLWPQGATAQVGKGRVLNSADVEAALAQAGIAPDFHFSGAAGDAAIPFVHRRLADGDSYFLVNRKDHTEAIEARFRITGMAPQLWHAESGTLEAVSYRTENGETIVPLTLGPDDSVHVVFRSPASAPALDVEKAAPTELGQVAGPWQVSFQPGRGAPPSARFTDLLALDERTEAGIKYFSGIATYTNSFVAPKGWKAGQPLWLDLGEAKEIAEVTLNGKLAGYAWRAPYRVDIGALAKNGRNSLQIRVANLWVNRLVGDAQPGVTQKITWTALPTYIAKAPLRRSGLIGPVKLIGRKD